MYIGGGPWGGLTPLRALSQAVFPPPQRGGPRAGHHAFGCHGNHTPRGRPKRATLRGCFRSNPPRMAPLILGLLGFARSIPGRVVTDLYRFFGLSWEIFLVIVELHSQLTTCSRACFFFRNRPLERLPHQSCRAFRGEVDSGIPGVFGGF